MQSMLVTLAHALPAACSSASAASEATISFLAESNTVKRMPAAAQQQHVNTIRIFEPLQDTKLPKV